MSRHCAVMLGNIVFKNDFTKKELFDYENGGKKLFDLCYRMKFLTRTNSDSYKFSHMKLRDYFAINQLIRIITSEKQIGKGFAAYAFEQIGKMATTPLINLLSSNNSDVIVRALWSLGLIKDNKAIPTIIDLLSNDDPFVVCYAIETLGEIGNDSVVDYLIEKLYEYEPDPSIRLALARALGKLSSKKAIPVLHEILNDDEALVRDAAAGALEEIGTEEAINILEEWSSKKYIN